MADAGIFRPEPRDNAAVRFVCFPFAGGGAAAFRLWPKHLPLAVDVVSVHPAGRAHRLREPPLHRVADMVEAYARNLEPFLDRPVAIFGHSLGAIVAGEFARKLQAEGRAPVHLFLSARVRREEGRTIHALAEPRFIEEMNARYQGIPAQILQHPELLELLLPALRADVEALETYVPGGAPLRCPTHVFGGTHDRAVSQTDLEACRDEIEGPVQMRVFLGDHFYLEPQRDALLAHIASALAPYLPAGVAANR
jgi:medium-chain acyl-[acyl-carrier-protein] hydrolase